MWGSAYLQTFSASNLALTQSACLEKCSGQCSVEARGIWRILLCVTLLPFFFFFFPISSRSRSCPSQESLQLVNLWGRSAPHGPQPALLQPQRDPLLGEGSTPPSVSLWADLLHGGIPDLVLVSELVQPVSQVMHRAGAQRTTLSSRLVDWVFGPLGSDTDVSAGGETERRSDFSFTSEHFLNTLQKQAWIDWQVWRNLRSYLECGSSLSLRSSGLTKCCSSSVFSTDTLSRSRLSLFLNQILSLEKEERSLGLSKECWSVIIVTIWRRCCISNRLQHFYDDSDSPFPQLWLQIKFHTVCYCCQQTAIEEGLEDQFHLVSCKE